MNVFPSALKKVMIAVGIAFILSGCAKNTGG
jgi:hypothetical protein